jgi:hypothetical protein
MRTLSVHKFSCIGEASLQIAPITLLIGPQASGKSVLCKLSYFFASLLTEQIRAISEVTPHATFITQVKAKFVRWFPFETWGPHKFELSFDFGHSRIEIGRTVAKGKAGKGVNVRFDSVFIEHYERSLSRIQEKSGKKGELDELQPFTYTSYVFERSVREDLRKSVGEDYVTSQLFIPAARSFFTSVGKAIPAFESGNFLDPLTLSFGKTFLAREPGYPAESSTDRSIQLLLENATRTMLGGKLVREREREVLHTSDGRTIPLTAFSSGQQELFPLLRVLPGSAQKGLRRLIYVEEPEAHLFPDAQSRLVELLASLSNLYELTVEMVITTHSPYVLTKFNNLIEAGKVGRRKAKMSMVRSLIPPSSWIQAGMLKAYAIEGGRLQNLMDKDGFIDGGYLDEVSNKIATEFTELLDIEFGDAGSHLGAKNGSHGRAKAVHHAH